MPLRTVISVNQLSIYGALADLCKELNKKSSEDSGEDSSEDSESSGTLYAKELLETRQLHREYKMPLNARCLLGGNAAISETDTNDKICNSSEEKTSITMSIVKLDGGTTESHGETRRQHLHLKLHSGQLRNGKRVGAGGHLHHLRNGGDFGFLERIPENRRECGQDTRSQCTSVQYSLFTSAERTSRAWLKGQHGSSNHGLHFTHT